MPDICMVYVTAPSREEAQFLGERLVSNGLAACANVIDGVSSTYLWDGVKCSSDEALLILKTIRDRLPELESSIKEHHSYDCPCFVALPIIYASDDFSGWVIASSGGNEK